MAKRKAGTKKAKQATDGQNGGVVALTKELFQAAITHYGFSGIAKIPTSFRSPMRQR